MMELWKNVKFVAYDLPHSKNRYEERMKELDEMFTNKDGTPNNPVVRIAPRRLCESKEHLERALEEVSNRGGEGIILRQPGSYYTPGPSDALREVKLVREDDVMFVERYKRTRGFKCKMRDGREIIVECPPIVFADPPPLNSIITVSYNSKTPEGLLKNAQYVKTKVQGTDVAEPQDKDEKKLLRNNKEEAAK